jgi:hypothetical protein
MGERKRQRPASSATNEGNAQMPPYERSKPLVLNDMPYRTTYRCVRLGCRLTARLLEPIDRCPRCDAQMAVIAAPERNLDEFFTAATENVVAGFAELLRAA